MNNATQLKAIIKNIAKEKGISAQLVMQNYMLERLLERISISKYRSNFILKGGMLIASMVGLDTRATMDMDATIKGVLVSEKSIQQMFLDLCKIEIADNITFSFIKIDKIREGSDYLGYRVSLTANYPPMSVPLKLDITSGDSITPKETYYNYNLLLDNMSINILAYNIETVLAEKLECIISRGDQNTRPRDFYDVFILHKLHGEKISYKCLNTAIIATADQRNTTKAIRNHESILKTILDSNIMHKYWLNYQKEFDYAKNIGFTDTCASVSSILNKLID